MAAASVSKSVSASSDPFASRLSYYIALACILLTVYLVRGHRKEKLNLPFYKAAKSKWIFCAEDLVRDSYNKVGPRLVGLLFPLLDIKLALSFLSHYCGRSFLESRYMHPIAPSRSNTHSSTTKFTK